MRSKYYAKRIVTKDGFNIYYWFTPGDKKTPIVMHSGASMNHSSLQALESMLNKEGHPTISFDHRGVGYSDAPKKTEFYSLERFSNDLDRIIDQERLEKPILLGHSLGFMVNVDYAANTQNCSKIIGVCGTYDFSKTASFKYATEAARALRKLERVGSLVMRARYFLRGEKIDFNDQSSLIGKSDLEVFKSIVDLPMEGVLANNACGDAIDTWNIVDQLKRLTVPMVLVYGKNDIMVQKKAGEYINEIVSQPGQLIELNGTHSIPLTSPEKVFQAIKNHL